MPIADWFKAREDRKYTPSEQNRGSGDVPDGVWSKCESCKHIIYEGELAQNARVCNYCGHHFPLTAPQRIELLVDEDTFEETHAHISSGDPLEWSSPKSYPVGLESAREKSSLAEAVMTGRASIADHPVVIGAMDFRFVGASMGSVVGEKVARAFELALAEHRPLVLSIASGGARMQEGMLSLMQMAKTSAAAARLADEGVPYISVLTNPTYGGVTASFAVLADVIVAEPASLVGFTGQRIIEQTIRQKLPKGFQTAEFLVEHGMIDEVIPRSDLRAHIGLLLDYLDIPGGERS